MFLIFYLYLYGLCCTLPTRLSFVIQKDSIDPIAPLCSSISIDEDTMHAWWLKMQNVQKMHWPWWWIQEHICLHFLPPLRPKSQLNWWWPNTVRIYANLHPQSMLILCYHPMMYLSIVIIELDLYIYHTYFTELNTDFQ